MQRANPLVTFSFLIILCSRASMFDFYSIAFHVDMNALLEPIAVLLCIVNLDGAGRVVLSRSRTIL
jgi:hypothetical protein